MTTSDGTATSNGPRRSGLRQERSRRTRQRLVRAAVELWTERGFEQGVDETTVDEIAQSAGVTKGTFYFHFAHKEDVLLEMAVETAEVLAVAAAEAIDAGRPAVDTLHSLMTLLARRVERAPRAAVVRSIAEVSRAAHDLVEDQPGSVAFANTFSRLATYGAERGEIPAEVDPDDFGALLQAVIMDSIMRWAKRGTGRLRPMLSLHTDLVLAGAAQAYRDQGR